MSRLAGAYGRRKAVSVVELVEPKLQRFLEEAVAEQLSSVSDQLAELQRSVELEKVASRSSAFFSSCAAA